MDASPPLARVGGSASHTVTDEGALQITGTGHDVQRADDGKSFMLHQGAHPGDWEMTVKVLDYPRGPQGAKAGLMVRESAAAGERYAAIAVAYHNDSPALQVLVRDRDQTRADEPVWDRRPSQATCLTAIEGNGEGRLPAHRARGPNVHHGHFAGRRSVGTQKAVCSTQFYGPGHGGRGAARHLVRAL